MGHSVCSDYTRCFASHMQDLITGHMSTVPACFYEVAWASASSLPAQAPPGSHTPRYPKSDRDGARAVTLRLMTRVLG